MKRFIRLDNTGIFKLQCIIVHLTLKGRTLLCPRFLGCIQKLYNTSNDKVLTYDANNLSTYNDCHYCKILFPKIEMGYQYSILCPCHVYKPTYLIKRLKEIIEFNRKESKKINNK